MKPFKDEAPFSKNEKNNNRRILSKLTERLGHLRHKVSRGAASIFRAMKSRTKWGNKNQSGKQGQHNRDHHKS